jgi:nitrite reductase (NADH) large subunit
MNTPTSPKQHLIVIGNGMVGHHLVEQLVERGAQERYRITVFGEERHLAYDRVHLSEYFSGRDAASLALSTADYYAEHGITLRLNEAVTAIDRDASEVVTPEGPPPLRPPGAGHRLLPLRAADSRQRPRGLPGLPHPG